MSETALPPVAKSFTTFCKKCDADRYHTVLAHSTATSAKVQCEVCKAKSTYKLPKAGGTAAKRPLTGAALKRKEQAASARKNAHANEYSTLLSSVEATDSQKYNMRNKFTVNTKLDHPKFGLGFIRAVQPEKIEVVFEDEVRQLVHNRG